MSTKPYFLCFTTAQALTPRHFKDFCDMDVRSCITPEKLVEVGAQGLICEITDWTQQELLDEAIDAAQALDLPVAIVPYGKGHMIKNKNVRAFSSIRTAARYLRECIAQDSAKPTFSQLVATSSGT